MEPCGSIIAASRAGSEKGKVNRDSRDNVTPPCVRCAFFYVTWDRTFPYGCRRFGFKTRSVPSQEVLRSSGAPCAFFRPAGKGRPGGEGAR